MKTAVHAVLLSVLGAFQVLGSPVGPVSGTVKDSSGAVVPSVKLTLTSTATNAAFTARSNDQGEFQFLGLAPATYSLLAETGGFKKINVSSVLVQDDQTTHLELTLEVGTASDSIPV